jgi:hypothetical protein
VLHLGVVPLESSIKRFTEGERKKKVVQSLGSSRKPREIRPVLRFGHVGIDPRRKRRENMNASILPHSFPCQWGNRGLAHPSTGFVVPSMVIALSRLRGAVEAIIKSELV